MLTFYRAKLEGKDQLGRRIFRSENISSRSKYMNFKYKFLDLAPSIGVNVQVTITTGSHTLEK